MFVPYNEERSKTVAGEFLYYLSGPAQITLLFDSVTQPHNQAGRTFNVPIKPGDAFRLPPGHEFQSFRVKNRSNTGETRCEILAGFGDYIMGPEPIAVQAAEPRLDYMAYIQASYGTFKNMGLYLANHFDSAKTLYVTDVQVVNQDLSINTNTEDAIYLCSGRNGTSASSADDDELGEHDSELGANLAASGPFTRTPMDHRFSDVSSGQVGAIDYAATYDPQESARWKSGHEIGGAGIQAQLINDKPSLPTPLVLPPGYTAVMRTEATGSFARKFIEVNFSWYELANGT
jgi:hypothetical protein